MESQQNLAFLGHLARVDPARLRILKVRHNDSRLARLQALEKKNEDRPKGCITLEEAINELDAKVVNDGFNVLYDEDLEEYVGLICYR